MTAGGFAAFDVVVMATSASGIAAYREILSTLPAEFPAAVIIVQHRSPATPALLEQVLRRRSRLQVVPASAGDQPKRGTVHVAPADRQLLLTPDRGFQLAEPADGRVGLADPLFTSVAQIYGPRAIGVVLTGQRNDGAAGVRAIKQFGGRVLVQDQATSREFGMPGAALASGSVDFMLPVHWIARTLVTLVMAPGAAELFQIPRAPWVGLS